MTTAIIITIIIIIAVFSVKSYIKKLSHGCCGSGGETVKSAVSATDTPSVSDCKFRYTAVIGGMSCKKCAVRIENAFARHGAKAVVDFKSGIAEIYSPQQLTNFMVRRIITGAEYTVERIEEHEL